MVVAPPAKWLAGRLELSNLAAGEVIKSPHDYQKNGSVLPHATTRDLDDRRQLKHVTECS